MNDFDPNNEQPEQRGYHLIGEVAQQTDLPTEDMIGFVLDILKESGKSPESLTLEELKAAMINYIANLD